ncbi:radical SAM protein, partial [Candidatus Gracilibacteria bacterium]|nr:radical SAM protein [Candidatus Gracilibacteria bacterium]
MKKIALYQPRHNHAALVGPGHVYLPSSLATVGSRILMAGGEIAFQDGNLRPLVFDQQVTGINLVGAPYIPEVIKLREQIMASVGPDADLVLGGQVLTGFTREQFQRLFGGHAYDGNDDAVLKRLLGMELSRLPPPEETSMIPFYEQISDADFHQYMEHEFCLYLSQGCKFACEFCAANRTFRDPVTGSISVVKERYRRLDLVDAELDYLVARSRRLGISHLEIYLSNLDTFQTPDQLKQFAEIVIACKRRYPGFAFRLRGLSTAATFMETYRTDPSVITAMVDAGLWSIGFGVDGTSKEVWKSIKKGHNHIDQCIEAIRLTREEFGITPEVFMVVGHATDTPDTLRGDVEFILDMADYYGAAPRPYVAKSIVPGNSGWRDPAHAALVEQLLTKPQYFQV